MGIEQQPDGNFADLSALGKRLSLEIDCPVAWPGFSKNVFRCKHDKVFPIYRLKGSDDWSWTVEEHRRGA